jgi:signal transduction histidine kinase
MSSRWSLRSRLMLVGLTGVAGALLVGGLALYLAMTTTLNRSVDDAARRSARQVAALIDAGRLPRPLPQSGAQIVQVLDSGDRVLAGTVTADLLTPLAGPAEREQLARGRALLVPGSRAALSTDLRLAGVPATLHGKAVLVVAALPTADLETSRTVLRRLLVGFFPLFLAGMALIAWRMITSALRPVEDLRAGAERIDETSADDERLAVPPTGDEISALARTLNGMLDRLSAARARQRVFVADAAHELRSPLASIRTQLEVAERIGDGGRLPTDLLPEVQRLSGLVEDLLMLARLEDRAATADVGADVGEVLADVAARRQQGRVPVRLVQVEESLIARIHRDHLTRAVTNLVDNAVRHADSRVLLEAAGTTRGIEIRVSDDGRGIAPPDRERVFDRFARLDEARDRDRGGVGLGLAIARQLIRNAGGDIRLEDAGPGIRAVIALPE